MAPTAPTAPGATSRLATGKELQSLAAELQSTFARASAPDSELSAVHDVSGELGYGCVDWFIYVSDSVDAPDVIRQTAG